VEKVLWGWRAEIVKRARGWVRVPLCRPRAIPLAERLDIMLPPRRWVVERRIIVDMSEAKDEQGLRAANPERSEALI
jgi:hypothetical protein